MDSINTCYKLQDEVLSVLSEFAGERDFPFVLTGGTALVRFLLKKPYRVSYDLDFFSTREFAEEEVKAVEKYLSRSFPIELSESALDEKGNLIMCKIVIQQGNTNLKIDFVQDVFAGIFEPVALPNVKLFVDSIEAIYFRKIYAFVSAYRQGIGIDRVKDVLDLMELDEHYKPFPEFVMKDFQEIWKQNFSTLVHPGQIIQTLSNMFNDMGLRRKEVETMLERKYFSRRTVTEIERWLTKQVRHLKAFPAHERKEKNPRSHGLEP